MNLLPDHAKKVFTGKLFDVYHWEQELFDGSSATFEAVRRQPSTEVIVVQDDKILVLQQEQPRRPTYPSLPGGRVEEGEDLKAAALRELTEETGYTADLEFFFESHGYQKHVFHESFFIGRNPKKITEPDPGPGERMSLTWVSFDEFLQLARNDLFASATTFKFMLYEALIDKEKKEQLRKRLFG